MCKLVYVACCLFLVNNAMYQTLVSAIFYIKVSVSERLVETGIGASLDAAYFKMCTFMGMLDFFTIHIIVPVVYILQINKSSPKLLI